MSKAGERCQRQALSRGHEGSSVPAKGPVDELPVGRLGTGSPATPWRDLKAFTCARRGSRVCSLPDLSGGANSKRTVGRAHLAQQEGRPMDAPILLRPLGISATTIPVDRPRRSIHPFYVDMRACCKFAGSLDWLRVAGRSGGSKDGTPNGAGEREGCVRGSLH